jgi:polar amino acid transport system permease protein
MMRAIGSGDFLYILYGLAWTAALSFAALLAGGLLSAMLVSLRLLRSRPINGLIYGYVTLFQGTPLLGQLMFFYFGLSIIGIETSPFLAAVLALTLHAAAFLSEIWRGAIQAIPVQQWEAGESLGLSRPATLLYVVLPQAVRAAIPPTVGFLVILIKDSSLASLVGFVETMRAAQIVSNSTFRPFLVYGTAAALYFCLCWPIAMLSRHLETRVSY